MTDTALTKRLTPTRAFRGMLGPYRDKMERSDAARGKLEGRMRRALDLHEQEQREIWGLEAEESETSAPATPSDDVTTQSA